MTETIRGIRVRIDVDTNKATYTLDEEHDSLDEVVVAVGLWIDELFREQPFGQDAYATITTASAIPPGGGLVTYNDGHSVPLKMAVVEGMQNDDGTWTYSLDRVDA